jgi:hypothetical protein
MAPTTSPVPFDDELPDSRLFWVWVGRALRPYVGWICAVIGLVVIFFGWLGVSGQALVAKQLPYLISGGIGGIAIVGVGAAYVAVEQIRRDSGRLDKLERMVEDLHAVLLSRADAAPAGAGDVTRGETADLRAPAPASSNGAPGLVALPVGQTYHRPGCSMVQGKPQVERVTAATVSDRGLRACRLCEPELATAPS